MTVIQIDQRVDATGLNCPMPIVLAAKAMKTLSAGATIEVIATDPGSWKDFQAWTRTTGHELVEASGEGPVYRFVIRHK